MQFHYIGEVEVTFPSISKVLQPGETFDAPDDFVAHNVEPVGAAQSGGKLTGDAIPAVPDGTVYEVSNESTEKVGE